MYAMDHTLHFEHRTAPRGDRWSTRRDRRERPDSPTPLTTHDSAQLDNTATPPQADDFAD